MLKRGRKVSGGRADLPRYSRNHASSFAVQLIDQVDDDEEEGPHRHRSSSQLS